MKYPIPGIPKEETISNISKGSTSYSVYYFKKNKSNTFFEWEYPFARIKGVFKEQIIKYVESTPDSITKILKQSIFTYLSSMATAMIITLIAINVINVANPIIQMMLALVPAHTTLLAAWGLFQEVKQLRDKHKYSTVLEVDQILDEIKSDNKDDNINYEKFIDEVSEKYGVGGSSNDITKMKEYLKLKRYLLQLLAVQNNKESEEKYQITYSINCKFIHR